MFKEKARKPKEMDRELYETESLRLQAELAEMQKWVKPTGARAAVIFEGCDTVDKGDAIKRVAEYLNLRTTQVVTLPTPSKREKSQRFFQHYITCLPAVGEIKLFNRPWYNQGGAEYVMDYCTADEHRHSLRQCPIFERILVEDGIILLKY